MESVLDYLDPFDKGQRAGMGLDFAGFRKVPVELQTFADSAIRKIYFSAATEVDECSAIRPLLRGLA